MKTKSSLGLLLLGLCLLFSVSIPAGAVSADGSYVYDPADPSVYKDRVVNYWEEFEASRIPLIAALPEKDIYLYAVKPKGVILYVKGTGHYYDWEYLTPRFILPSLYTGDYDSDKEEEVAVVTYTGSGTGYAVQDLHIVETGKDEILSRDPASKDYFVPNPEYFREHFYTPEAYIAQLDQLVKLSAYHVGDVLMADVSTGGKKSALSLKAIQEWAKDFTINEQLCLGNIVHFTCEGDRINAEFELGITSDAFPPPVFIGNIKAEVVYREDGFALKNLSFEPEAEYRISTGSSSPDGKYSMDSKVDESQGIYQVIQYDGESSKAISTYDIIGKDFTFLWSPDSTKVCAVYSGRIWSHFSIIDVENKKLLEFPPAAEIIKKLRAGGAKISYELNENRPDPYIVPIKWSPDGKILTVSYKWYDKGYNAQNGVFSYNIDTGAAYGLTQYPPMEG